MASAKETIITGMIKPLEILHHAMATSEPMKQTQSLHSGFFFSQKSEMIATMKTLNAVTPVTADPQSPPVFN